MRKRLINVGLIAVRNEAEDIRGWAKTMLYFCKKVVCVIDPGSSDNTEEILRTEFPQIIIEYQDRSLGDSDDGHMGKKRKLICHANYDKFLKQYVNVGEWHMEMAPDERFDPKEFALIEKDLKYAMENGHNGLIFPNYYTFKENYETIIDWYSHFIYGSIRQMRFKILLPEFSKGLNPHSSSDGFPENYHDTLAGFYHFCWMKETRPPFAGWRDEIKYNNFKTLKYKNPINDWKNMPDLDNNGELIFDKLQNIIK